MRTISFAAIAVTACLASSAVAATVPKVAGKYGITVATECASIPEGTGIGVGKMTFPTTPASSNHISMSYQWFDRKADGTISQQSKSVSGHLKLTATTFKITPTSGPGPSGPMSFGALDTDGVAGTLNFLWTDYDDGFQVWCLHTLGATKQ
jgi:hypothetical protein